MHSLPVTLIFTALLAALVTSMAGGWRRLAAGGGALAAVVLWLLLWTQAPTGQSGAPPGGGLALTAATRSLFLPVLAGMGLLFLLAVAFPQGRKFVPATLAALAFLLAAMMARPATAGALLLVMGLALLAVAAQDERAGAAQGALRYLGLAVLALPFLLVASWLAETQSTAGAAVVARAVVFSGLILLAVFPFHVWATTLVREASPLVWALLFGPAQLVVAAFLFSLLPGQPEPALRQLLALAGAVTLLVAMLLMVTAVALPQIGLRRLISGLLLVDMAGVALLLTAPAEGWPVAVTLHMARFVALLLIALALFLGPKNGGPAAPDRASSGPERGRRASFSLLLLLAGCLSLLGLPLTFGFGGRWRLVQLLLAADAWWLALLLLAAMGVGTLVLLRALRCWLAKAVSFG